jgi:hypothetical protein
MLVTPSVVAKRAPHITMMNASQRRAPQAGRHGVGGEPKQHIAPEERAVTEAAGHGGQAGRLVQGQRSDRDIEPIGRVEEIGQPAEERRQPPRNLAHDGLLLDGRHGFLPPR